MTRVDSHMHLNLNHLSITDIFKYLDKEKIDFCWLLSWEEVKPGPWTYENLTIEDLYQAYLDHPARIVPFYAPDPHKPEAAAQLENWHQKGIRGCGELKATIGWNSNSLAPVLQTAGRLKMPVVFHMEESGHFNVPYSNAIYDRILFECLNTEKKIYQIPRSILRVLASNFTPIKCRAKSYFFPGYMLDFASLEVTLQKHPEVNFIGHGPMFWRHMSFKCDLNQQPSTEDSSNNEGIIWRLLKDYPNLYADVSGGSGLSALKQDLQQTRKFLSLFEDKILYGTDNFLEGQRMFLESLGLSKGVYKKIFGENACKMLDPNRLGD